MRLFPPQKTVKKIRFCSLLSCLLLPVVSPGVLQAGTPVAVADGKAPVLTPQEAAFHLPGTFSTGVKTSDVYTEGNISLVVPLWSSLGSDGTLGGGYVFLTPYTSLGEQGELANSLGLGWRYLLNDQPVSAARSDTPAGWLTEGFYVGGNVFVDNLETQFDNDFWQMGFGVEIGTRYLELRGNYYLPLDGSQKLARRDVNVQRYTSRRSSSRTSYSTQNDYVVNEYTSGQYATGHSIVQDVNLTNISTTSRHTTTSVTTTRTTVKTITSLYEEGMEGWDVEAAFLIPGLDQYMDVSILAGYYDFNNQPFGPQDGPSGNTQGWKLGLEVRPVPALVLTAMWYEDEGLTGSDWVVGAGLQIPLGKEWKDAFKSRRRHLIERLSEPVARQNAAIKTSLNYDVDQQVRQQSRTQTSSHSAVVQQTVTQEKGRIIIAENIVFANGPATSDNGVRTGYAGGNGTAERPFNNTDVAVGRASRLAVFTGVPWKVYTQTDINDPRNMGIRYIDGRPTLFTSGFWGRIIDIIPSYSISSDGKSPVLARRPVTVSNSKSLNQFTSVPGSPPRTTGGALVVNGTGTVIYTGGTVNYSAGGSGVLQIGSLDSIWNISPGAIVTTSRGQFTITADTQDRWMTIPQHHLLLANNNPADVDALMAEGVITFWTAQPDIATLPPATKVYYIPATPAP